MKKKILNVLLMGILVIGLTGCGKTESEKVNDKGNESKELLSSKVKVGDYVSYNAGNDNSYTSSKDKTGFEQDQTFKTTGKEEWRVLSIDDGIVTLVTENPIKTSTNNNYKFNGGKAYLNIVDELNAISNIYSKGEYATSGRNMTYDDIIKIIGYDVFSEKYSLDLSNKSNEEKIDLIKKALANNNESSRNTNFGTQFSITNEKNKYVPSNDNEDGYVLGDAKSLTDNYIPSTNIYQYIIKEEDKLSLAFGNNNENFWLATTFIQKGGAKNDENSTYAYYGVYYAIQGKTSGNVYTNSSITPYTLMISDLRSMSGMTNAQGVRPVVVLDKNTPVIKGTGTKADPYTLS